MQIAIAAALSARWKLLFIVKQNLAGPVTRSRRRQMQRISLIAISPIFDSRHRHCRRPTLQPHHRRCRQSHDAVGAVSRRFATIRNEMRLPTRSAVVFVAADADPAASSVSRIRLADGIPTCSVTQTHTLAISIGSKPVLGYFENRDRNSVGKPLLSSCDEHGQRALECAGLASSRSCSPSLSALEASTTSMSIEFEWHL